MVNYKNLLENFNVSISDIDFDKIDLSSFKIKNTLNKNIWNLHNKIKQDILQNLIDIAEDFFEELKLPNQINLIDIIITGSLANYNWSKFSDIDLHLIIDFSQIDDNFPLIKSFLDNKRILWNKKHDIYIHDHEVEIYIQDINEKHHSSGVYSLYKNEWIIKPTKEKPTIDWNDVNKKVLSLIQEINELPKLYKDGEYQDARDLAQKLTEKIRCMRQCGLEKGGEYSAENIAFKILRRNGDIQKISDYRDHTYDTMMSLKEHYE
jgi:predicted nucleotidyltransferase